jgi:hypothetical protein
VPHFHRSQPCFKGLAQGCIPSLEVLTVVFNPLQAIQHRVAFIDPQRQLYFLWLLWFRQLTVPPSAKSARGHLTQLGRGRILFTVSNVNTVTHESGEEQVPVKPGIAFPADLWKEVKKAAVDADKSASQFVIDTLAEKLLPARGKRDSEPKDRR